MPKFDDEDVMENETAIPEPPTGTPAEVATRAWQVAWSASNAAAGYHASIINHLVAHEKKVVEEIKKMRADFARDFAMYRKAMVDALGAVGIRVDLSPSGEHAAVALGEGAGRDRVASSHDLEEGLAEVSDRVEEVLDERLRDLKLPGSIPSERVRALLAEERAHTEAEQRILRLELEKKQLELAHASEVQRLTDQRTDLAESNTRWLRIAFMVAGGLVTVLAGILIWALTKGHAALPD